MNTKALRQKILDLAIHGKLVPQDPNDEPASVLLERIRDEKERLIKEGKIKRSKKAKATSDKPHYENVPFEVPSSWVWTTLGDIAEIITGNTPSKDIKEYYSGNIPFFKPTDLEQGIHTKYSKDRLTPLGFEQSRKLPANSVLVTCIGATIGKTGLTTVEGTCNQQINAIIPTSAILAKFLFYICISDYMQHEIKANASATTLPILNKGNFSKIAITIPPLQEQSRIVKSIEHWLSLVDCIEKNKDNLQRTIKEAKSKILTLAIHGKLVPQDPTDEPASELLKRINPKAEITSDNGHYQKLPKGWCLCLLNDVLKEVFAGGDKPLIFSKNKSEENYIPIYANGTENKGLFGFTNKAQVYERCLTISARGTIGFTCIREVPFVPIVRLITAIPLPVINLLFLKHQIDTMLSYTEGSSIPQLTIPTIKRMLIILPPLKEQLRIVAKIEELFALLDTIKAQL